MKPPYSVSFLSSLERLFPSTTLSKKNLSEEVSFSQQVPVVVVD